MITYTLKHKPMEIKLVKKIDLLNEVWYFVFVDGTSIKASQNQKEAEEVYHKISDRAKQGYPKTETLKSIIL